MGLIEPQRDRYFNSFLDLHLFEDMAPWNIVFMGQVLEYIDYDTRDVTFDIDIPKSYQIMTVLMNYKRTVEDFKKCGSQSHTIYGLPYVSDCVGDKNAKFSCPDLKLPVPCGDGKCHTDYISCLKALSAIIDATISQTNSSTLPFHDRNFWSFNDGGLSNKID